MCTFQTDEFMLKLLKRRKINTKCNKTPTFSWNVIKYYKLLLPHGKNLAVAYGMRYKNGLITKQNN